MRYNLIVRPEAQDDLRQAFTWYETQRTGLGHEFLKHVDEGIKFISKNPEIHPVEYKDTRKHLIKRFPYKIVYLVEQEKIAVLAVMHGRRNPELLGKRIDSP